MMGALSKELFGAQLKDRLGSLGLTIADRVINDLWVHFTLLRQWKGKTNLVSRALSEIELVDLHYAESLAGLRLIQKQYGRLVDVGSGAGFPGWVLAVALAPLSSLLLEPRRKRVSFLELATAQTGHMSIRVAATHLLQCDRELLAPDGPLQGLVVSRATLPPDTLWKELAQSALTGYEVLVWTTPQDCATHSAQASEYGWTTGETISLPWHAGHCILDCRPQGTLSAATSGSSSGSPDY
jgi:16S rRNA G527 N7-methylase RsmG